MSDYKLNTLSIVPNSVEFRDVTPTFQVNYMSAIGISSMHVTLTDSAGSTVTIDTLDNAFVSGDANTSSELYDELMDLTNTYLTTITIP